MTNNDKLTEIRSDLRYLRLLQRDFPTISAVATEIINLEAILLLPKPTEHFLADLHGEYEAFEHVLRTSSGNIRRKVEELYVEKLSADDITQLCSLIYYPEKKVKILRENTPKEEHHSLYKKLIEWLVPVCRSVSHKYTRSRVRKMLPAEFAYIIEELLHEQAGDPDKQKYYTRIIETVVQTHRARPFIIALCHLIQDLSIDTLHILGDVFDRGPASHKILDRLMEFRHVDMTWGNHDVLRMGAAAGNPACVMAVLRLALRYANVREIEEGYNINLRQLATFAMETYADDDCEIFMPVETAGQGRLSEKERRVVAQMHKTVAVLQWKLEGQLYQRHPEWQMADRNLLENVKNGFVTLDGRDYELKDKNFPTLVNGAELTPDELLLVKALTRSFTHSDKLHTHIEYLLDKGHMYQISNGNLLFHASVPLDADGKPKIVDVCGQKVSGKALMERIDAVLRMPFDEQISDEERQTALDFYWYVWCGPDSPLFDKSKMATFERYLIADTATHQEEKGYYYKLRDEARILDSLMDEFGVFAPHRHIINGHVPVRAGKGESPVKGEGRLMVIDGGFSKAYHHQTGIAGYTLVYHSRGFELVQHAPFTSIDEAVKTGADIQSTTHIVEMTGRREMVADTDKGKTLNTQIRDLKNLLTAYRKGVL